MLYIAGFAYAAKYEIEVDSNGLTEDDNDDIQIVRDIQKLRITRAF